MVGWLLMSRTSEVLVQARESSKLFVTKVAFETMLVPDSFSSPGLEWASNRTVGIGDKVILVEFSDGLVHGMARGA